MHYYPVNVTFAWVVDVVHHSVALMKEAYLIYTILVSNLNNH